MRSFGTLSITMLLAFSASCESFLSTSRNESKVERAPAYLAQAAVNTSVLPSPSPSAGNYYDNDDEPVCPAAPIPTCEAGEVLDLDLSVFTATEMGECQAECTIDEPEFCGASDPHTQLVPTNLIVASLGASPSPSASPVDYGSIIGSTSLESCSTADSAASTSSTSSYYAAAPAAPAAQAEKLGGILPNYPVCSNCGQLTDQVVVDRKGRTSKVLKCEECVRTKLKNGTCYNGWICKRTSKSCEARQTLCDQHREKIEQCLKSKTGTVLSNGYDMIQSLACISQREHGCNCSEDALKSKNPKSSALGPFQLTKDTWETCRKKGILSSACDRPAATSDKDLAKDPRNETCCAAECAAELIQEKAPGADRWGVNAKACFFDPGPVQD